MSGVLRMTCLAVLTCLSGQALAQPDPPQPGHDELLEADVAALGIEDEREEGKLNLFGFVDFTWMDTVTDPNGPWTGVYPSTGTFAVGSLNLYLTRQLGRAWRTLIEVRYTHAPSGSVAADGSYTRSTSADPANLGRPVQWGGLVLERAYLEHDVTPWLSIRAGTFLTPYGIWNVDHGSPTIIPTIRPYVIGDQLFPERQTGLHVWGERPLDEYTVEYHATLSNGRGPLDGFRDLDANKAVGGRVAVTAPWLGRSRIGVSGYLGRFTDRPANYFSFDAEGNATVVVPAGVAYDDASVAADVLIQRGGLLLQAELIYNHRSYRGVRPLVLGVPEPDGHYLGAYLLAGHRFDRWWQVMPFAMLEVDRPWAGGGRPEGIVVAAGGLNFRPIPSVVLKALLGYVELDHPIIDEPAVFSSAQAAWVF